jgi:hypothetical protein
MYRECIKWAEPVGFGTGGVGSAGSTTTNLASYFIN